MVRGSEPEVGGSSWLGRYLGRMGGDTPTPPTPTPTAKFVVQATLGSFLGTLTLSLLHYEAALDHSDPDLVMIVGSFGAQAVLLFAAPRAALAQPWNCVFGNSISAVVGVLAWKLVGRSGGSGLDLPWLAAALAVSASILVMLLTRSLHPPGGASALIAVIGRGRVQSLGFLYVVFPIFLGSVVQVALAVLFNNLSDDPLRRYPTHWLPFALPCAAAVGGGGGAFTDGVGPGGGTDSDGAAEAAAPSKAPRTALV